MIIRPRRMSQREPKRARGHLARASNSAVSRRARASSRFGNLGNGGRRPGKYRRELVGSCRPIVSFGSSLERTTRSLPYGDRGLHEESRFDYGNALLADKRLKAARRGRDDRAITGEVLEALDRVEAERERVDTMRTDQHVGRRHPPGSIGVRHRPVKVDPFRLLEEAPRRVVEVIRPHEMDRHSSARRKGGQEVEVESLAVQSPDVHGMRPWTWQISGASVRVCRYVDAVVDHGRDDAIARGPPIPQNLTADDGRHFARECVFSRNEAFAVGRRQPSLAPVVRDVVHRRDTLMEAGCAENGVIDPHDVDVSQKASANLGGGQRQSTCASW